MGAIGRLKAYWAARVNRTADPAWELYRSIATPAVQPERLALFGLEDSPECRFELLALHLAAAWARMNAGGPDVRRMRRSVGDAFVADMDASLRDLGAGDLGVGKRVKALTERLYGRLAIYAPAFADGSDAAAVEDALARNLYKQGLPDDPKALARAAAEVGRLGALWRGHADTDIVAGKAPVL